jgi:hypothetical protein
VVYSPSTLAQLASMADDHRTGTHLHVRTRVPCMSQALWTGGGFLAAAVLKLGGGLVTVQRGPPSTGWAWSEGPACLPFADGLLQSLGGTRPRAARQRRWAACSRGRYLQANSSTKPQRLSGASRPWRCLHWHVTRMVQRTYCTEHELLL